MRLSALLISVPALLLAACSDAPLAQPETAHSENTVIENAEVTTDVYQGDWSGTLDVGAAQLRLVLEVRGESVVLISVDQSGARLPVEVTQRDEAGFAGTIARVGATLELAPETPTTLTGDFTQGGATFPLTLEHERRPTATSPQTGTPNPDFIVETDAVRLAGTLQIPESDGPFPTILLLNGSGAQDRNATVAGQPVFEVLADELTMRGIATLRLDDRGVGGSDAVAPASPHDLADDAVAAMAALREAEGINAQCVGILGHSEGGLIAFLAGDAADPAFIVSLAGMHGTMAETLYEQSEALFLASGAGQAAADQNRALQDAMFAVMRDDAVEDYPAALTEALTALGLPEATARQQGAIWGQDYAIAALDLDPSPAMAGYDGPVHAFFGERDLQVLSAPNTQRLLAAREGLPTQVTLLPGANHLFQAAETGLPQEYQTAPHAMSPAALSAIGDAAEVLVAQTCE